MNILYYFSGTGNSLHIAQELKDRLSNTQIVPILSLIQNEHIQIEADIVGFIFPIYALTLPEIIVRFIQKISKLEANYVFAFASRECSERVFKKISTILQKTHSKLNAGFGVETPQNYLPTFNVYSEEKIALIEKKLKQQLDRISSIILNNQGEFPKDTGFRFFSYIVAPIIGFFYHSSRFFNLGNRFYSDETCISCGICEKICLTNRIHILDNKPSWDPQISCINCLACIHYCPSQAIQIKRTNSATRGRYHHPKIKAKDIWFQKSTT